VDIEQRYARQVFLKYAKPLAAVPVPGPQAIAQQALQRQSGSSASGLAQSVARVARPDTRLFLPTVFNAEKAGALALRPAQAAAQVAARRTATQILMSPASVSAARELAAKALQPAARASAAVGGALSRTPVIGAAIQRISRFVPKGGPFWAATVLYSVPDVMEHFAPDVKKWLLGGWSQSGYKQNQLPPGVGQSAVLYNVICDVEIYDSSSSTWVVFGLGRDTVSNVLGPIESVLGPFESGNGSFITVRSANGQQISYGQTSYGSNGTFRLASIRVLRVDGIPEGNGSGSFTNGASAPKQTGTASTPAQTNNAKNARDAGIAAAAVTIAAGKFKLPPKLKRPPTQIPSRKVGVLPSASPTAPPPPSQPCKGNQCGQAGLDQATKNGQDLQTILDLLNGLGIGDIKKTVERIDTKIGPQITDAVGNKRGLTDMAVDTFKKVNKVGDYLRFDRITNVLNLAVTLHNAAMLSNNLAQTLMSAIGNGLDAIGIDDDAGNALNIQEIVGKTTENIVKGAIGAENYAALTTNWKKANRIYQASANLLNNLQSLRYSITGALETIGGMNAKVGNALKKYGVLGDNAYPWFNPSPNYDNKFMRGLEAAETTVSSIDSVASEILSAQDSVNQIGEQKTELEKAIKEGLEKPGVDNDQQKTKAIAAKTASKSPDIVSDNLIKPES
jgi:hypothetical protein